MNITLYGDFFHIISSTFPLLHLALGKEERPTESSARKVQFILLYGHELTLPHLPSSVLWAEQAKFSHTILADLYWLPSVPLCVILGSPKLKPVLWCVL